MQKPLNLISILDTPSCRDHLLRHVSEKEQVTLRLVCSRLAHLIAPRLFAELCITFKATTFTKPARIDALTRVGHHVSCLQFSMPHSAATFLPPLLDGETGEEVDFVYEPICDDLRQGVARLRNPAYGNTEMTDLLVKQYPPQFHAATNVSSFIRALNAVPNLRHLKISCPGQELSHCYRRDVVDYALMSLRIAVERASLTKLRSLSLLGVHAAATQYLNPIMGLGARPNALQRWRQIQSLTIELDAIPPNTENHPHLGIDHYKLLHAYLQVFRTSVQRLTFHWQNGKGFFPLALDTETALQRSSPSKSCPQRHARRLPSLHFPRLRFLEVDHITTDAASIAAFIHTHRKSIREFRFDRTDLRQGTWEEALAPLTQLSGGERWREQLRSTSAAVDADRKGTDRNSVVSPTQRPRRSRDKLCRSSSEHTSASSETCTSTLSSSSSSRSSSTTISSGSTGSSDIDFPNRLNSHIMDVPLFLSPEAHYDVIDAVGLEDEVFATTPGMKPPYVNKVKTSPAERSMPTCARACFTSQVPTNTTPVHPDLLRHAPVRTKEGLHANRSMNARHDSEALDKYLILGQTMPLPPPMAHVSPAALAAAQAAGELLLQQYGLQPRSALPWPFSRVGAWCSRRAGWAKDRWQNKKDVLA